MSCWVSPFDSFQEVADVVAALQRVAARFPGASVRVVLPTTYGETYQSAEADSIGMALRPSDLAGYAALCAEFAAAGFACDGWCVPRLAPGTQGEEGAEDGDLAAVFASKGGRWIFNCEAGWAGFLLDLSAEGAQMYLAPFWAAVDAASQTDALNGRVGMTYVNVTSMRAALSDAALTAWFDGTNLTLTESYGPAGGEPDPATDVPTVQALHARLGFPDRPVQPILAPANDVEAQAEAAGGIVGLWTLGAANA